MMRLATESLTVGRSGRVVLGGVELAVASGEILGLLGPNGAGKTTLLRALAGIDSPQAGAVTFEGRPLLGIDRTLRARSIGFLPQPPEAVWPVSVENLVGLGRLPFSGPFGRPHPDDRTAIEDALAACDLLPLRYRSVATLSAGEASRAFLARVLAGRPRLLLADEPTANLDPAHQLAVMETMRRLAAAGATIVMSQHDLPLACRFCDRLALLAEGKIVAQGRPRDVATPENLARVFGVAAHFAAGPDDEFFALPWSLVAKTVRDDIVGL